MKKIYYSLIVFCFLMLGTGFYFYTVFFGVQIKEDTNFYIKSTDNLELVMQNLTPFCNDISDLKLLASIKKYKYVKAGKYVLKQGMNTNNIINLLRSGKQTPVKVSFNNQDYIEHLAGRLATQIEADSTSILKSLTAPSFLKDKGLNRKTVLNICMPYTYDCYWNIRPKQLRNKFLKAYELFWNKGRVQKTKQLHLTQNQVITLASIVQKETAHKPERAMVAGVYLNRVKKGMPLQADPTVIYALKEKYGRDTVIKRVLKKDLSIPSAYNTYIHPNIPPAAIAMPDIDAIDAVLNAKKHSFYYFCANPKKLGTHVFANTLSQHHRNAYAYQRWLNKQKIRR